MATTLELHAAWALIIAFGISVAYEIWRATTKTTRHDSVRILLTQGTVLYGSGAVVIGLLLAGVTAADWIGLAYSIVLIAVSIFYYNPKTMMERQPGLIDWAEDLVYTGLLFVAAVLLAYEVSGGTLVVG